MTIQFKIQIRGIKKPPVWRRIAIPGNFTFHDLHRTIQAAFGWWNKHLYQFQRHPFDHGWNVRKLELDKSIDDMWIEQPKDARETNVGTFIQFMKLIKFVYVYDFGDSWVHDITVEDIDNEAELGHPICLAGKGACPPEDCGGIWGYEYLKEEMDKEEINEFDIEEVNKELKSVTVREKDHEDNDADNLQLHPAGGMPEPIKLISVVGKITKGELVDFAEELGFDIDESISEKQYYKQYAKAMLDNPVKVLKQLPLEDLNVLGYLKDHPTEGNIVDCYDNYYCLIVTVYGLVTHWWDDEDLLYIQVPEDLWKAMSPHIEEVMNDPAVQHRIVIESFVLGLANLYGQVSVGFVEQELVRTDMVKTIEEAKATLAIVSKDSLLMKFIIHQTDSYDNKPTADNLLYLSRYGWDVPNNLALEIKKHESLAGDYKLFTKHEIIYAARTPIPQIANPAQKAFSNLLTNDIGMNKWQAMEVCHSLWFLEMHKHDNAYDNTENTVATYFRDYVLDGYNCSDSLFRKAMELLDDYLNNMPHWQLKGHTPEEVQVLLSEESKAAKREPRSRRIYEPEDNFPTDDWLFPREITLPIIMKNTPGRNEPCPCGSGKKYKNCCGKGN